MHATTLGSMLLIPPIRLPNGSLSAPCSIDLTTHQGRTARIYINAAGLPEISPCCSYWQVAEVLLPIPATETVTIGTREVLSAEPVSLVRGATAVDAVSLAANQFIGSVGFSWAPYRLSEDYLIVSGGIEWVADGRAPQDGDAYTAEIVTATTVPITEQRALPLDLAQHAVTLFDLPQ